MSNLLAAPNDAFCESRASSRETRVRLVTCREAAGLQQPSAGRARASLSLHLLESDSAFHSESSAIGGPLRDGATKGCCAEFFRLALEPCAIVSFCLEERLKDGPGSVVFVTDLHPRRERTTRAVWFGSAL